MSKLKIAKFMESVKPTKIWIDGKCHVVHKYGKNGGDIILSEAHVEILAREYDINIMENLYHTSFKLATPYYHKINTFNIITVEDLEKDTRTEINVPKEESDEKIVIKGSKLENVVEARLKLQSLISTIRERHAATQFISIPVQSEQVKAKFEEFKKAVLAERSTISGMHESIFQKAERLHLTIAVFALMDEVEKIEAVKALEQCKAEIIKPFIANTGPLKIHIQGLDCMHSSYDKTHVLYANAKFDTEDDENNLQNIVNSIANYFYGKGLVRQAQDSVKLHVTLINTKYRKTKKRWSRIPFNANGIIQKYGGFDFGMCNFESIHLSHICSMDTNGFYKSMARITL